MISVADGAKTSLASGIRLGRISHSQTAPRAAPLGVGLVAAARGDHVDAVRGPWVVGVARILVGFLAKADAHADGEVAAAEDEGFERRRGA